MAVCQILPVKGRTLYFEKNQLRMKGVEFRAYGRRIMRRVRDACCELEHVQIFAKTALRSLDVVLDTGYNCYLFGRELDSLRTIVKECNRLPYIVPLGWLLHYS